MSDRPRVGIVGTGFMGGVHSRAVTAVGATVTAILGSTPERSAEAAARLPGARPAADLADLLDDVDVVHLCTPNHLHARDAEQALAAGVPVVCEKPLATTLADAERLTAAAGAAALVTAVPFVYRYHPLVREARARIAADPDAGLWLLHGSYLQDWLGDQAAGNWRVDPALGGGTRAFGDIGVHWCDLMEYVTGHRITRVLARFGRAFEERGPQGARGAVRTEDGAVVSFETDRGAIGSLVVSQASAGRRNRLWFSFDGPSTSYSFDQEGPEQLWIGGRTANTTVLRDPALPSAHAERFDPLPAGHPQGYRTCFEDFAVDVHAALAGRPAHGLPTFADGLRAARISAAVTASAANGTFTEVPT
ncbi:Gfo/Idh/MocA family protein [Kitasatospora sp. NPDC057015]|uniref:Gfo/Idh/MocA family protein n=1 Tax=Kitasatospora sp. NPDC057015 TaxID=3346001 RepID=UPI0036312636